VADLPLILAGPIVRRVEPELATVWVALRERRHVKLDVWRGPIAAGTRPAPDFAGKGRPTIRVGPSLHIGLATVTPTGDLLQPEQTYSYDVSLGKSAEGAFSENLGSLGLLKDRDNEKNENVHLALGYEAGRLPTFVLPPKELKDLRLLHGSCRRPQVDVPDAMVFIDDLLREARDDPKGRPHQLFLTGDQIYADDVGNGLMLMMLALGERLLGEERVPTRWPHLDPKRPVTFEPVGRFFAPRYRQLPILEDARFTTVDGENHLISLADFAAHYLLVWNRELWGPIPTFEQYFKDSEDFLKTQLALDGMSDDTANKLRQIFKALDPPDDPTADPGDKKPKERVAEGFVRHIGVLTRFRDGLPRVRRALANIATYMMFDDHEITDDWFLSSAWRDRALTSPLGRTIFRNGLVAYALFQGWGNDPTVLERSDEPHAKLRALIEKLVPEEDEKTFTPDPQAAPAIDKLLGFSGAAPEFVRWHYTAGGPKHHVLVLDCRNQRSYRSRLSGPGNISLEGLKEQIPDRPPPPGTEVTVVISSLTVLGPPVIDAILGPLVFRIFDLASNKNKPGIPGLDPDAIEAWPYDDLAFEALLARLQPLRRVVFLSGDVHFGTSAAMTYWKQGVPDPTRFAQFTSSGLKNQFKKYVANPERSLAFLQALASTGVLMERLGWETRRDDRVKVPPGVVVKPALRFRLGENPVIVPTTGWPKGTTNSETDWSWRMEIVEDRRPDAERPKGARPADLVPGQPGVDVADDVDGYRKVAARHVAQLDRMSFGRRLVFASNVGRVSFERSELGASGRFAVKAIHELFAQRLDDSPEDDASPQPYTRHEVSLEHDGSEPPKIGDQA